MSSAYCCFLNFRLKKSNVRFKYVVHTFFFFKNTGLLILIISIALFLKWSLHVYFHDYRTVSWRIHGSANCLLEKRGVTSFLSVYSITRHVRCLSDDQRFSTAIIPLIMLPYREFRHPISFYNCRYNSRLIVNQDGYRCPKLVKLNATMKILKL